MTCTRRVSVSLMSLAVAVAISAAGFAAPEPADGSGGPKPAAAAGSASVSLPGGPAARPVYAIRPPRRPRSRMDFGADRAAVCDSVRSCRRSGQSAPRGADQEVWRSRSRDSRLGGEGPEDARRPRENRTAQADSRAGVTPVRSAAGGARAGTGTAAQATAEVEQTIAVTRI